MTLDLPFKYRFIPSTETTDKIMIVLHGRGDSIRPFFKFNQELKLKKMNYLLLNAHRKYDDGFSWYGEPPYKKNNLIELRSKLFDVIKILEEQGWKSKNIFLLGFSQGSLVCSDVALHYKKALGGIIGVSGYFCFFSRWYKNLNREQLRTPWLMLHGTEDDILPIGDTRYGVLKLQHHGLNVEWHELQKDHSLLEKDCQIIKRWLTILK